MRRLISIAAAAVLIASQLVFLGGCGNGSSGGGDQDLKNVILFIGDGMGPEQVKAGGMYLNGSEGSLSFEAFPYSGTVTTLNAGGGLTDSAASGTAIATGVKVNNGVISVRTPGDGSDLETLLEHFKALGWSTGLVTTTFMTHATPGAFGAHEPSRASYLNIAGDYINDSKPNVLFGGAAYITPSMATTAGYTVVTNLAELQALDKDAVTMASGQFGLTNMPYEFDGLGTLPHLSDMTEAALDILDKDPDGFFLMVEGGRIDHASHANDIERTVREVAEFSNSVQSAIDWATGRGDTLIIVTADHETGGLTVVANNGAGLAPTVTWAGASHTTTDVPVYAWGKKSSLFSGAIDNTDIHDFVLQ